MNNQTIKNYLARQLTEQAKILKLSAYNREGQPYQRRDFYYSLDRHIQSFLATASEPRWLLVSGLRGVGKTTVLAQLFFDYQTKFKGRILYVSLDDVVNKLGSDLYTVLSEYEDLLGESFASLTDNVLLLLDEVHFDPKWSLALKSLYDQSRRVFIISTGSSAIAINHTADIARRSLLERMYPLKFSEYTRLTTQSAGQSGIDTFSLGQEIAAALWSSTDTAQVARKLTDLSGEVRRYWQETDSRAIERYIRYYSLPSVLPYNDDAAIYRILNSVVDRIVQKDLATIKTFSPAIIAKIPTLLFLVATSDIRSLAAFTKDLQDIDSKTLMTVFLALEQSELLLRIYPFSLSAPKRVRKPSKYLFLASSLRAALIHLTDSRAIDARHRGKLLEDSVGLYLHRYFSEMVGSSLSYDDTPGGADFIVDAAGKKIVIEVGWNKRQANQVILTMKNYQADYGLLITNSSLVESRNNILTLPFEFFFLL